MKQFDKQHLIDSGYLQVDYDVYAHPEEFVQFNNDKTQLVSHCLSLRADKKLVAPELKIFKYCTFYKTHLHINDFAARPDSRDKTKLRFSSLSLPGDNERSKLRKKEFNDINYPLIRMFFNGTSSELLKCGVTSVVLEQISEYNESIEQTRTFGLTEFHHMLTVGGNSVHKLDKETQPSYILDKRDLTLEENRPFLLDIMNTVVISPTEHTKVHVSSRHSDIRYWVARNGLAWALKNKDNFSKFCSWLPYDIRLDYDYFMSMQTLEWFEQHKHLLTEQFSKANAEDLQKYANRFNKDLLDQSLQKQNLSTVLSCSQESIE